MPLICNRGFWSSRFRNLARRLLQDRHYVVQSGRCRRSFRFKSFAIPGRRSPRRRNLRWRRLPSPSLLLVCVNECLI